MSSISFRLGPVSTSSGTTAPGKITMSERPSTGSISGSERADIRGGVSAFSAAPSMLTNSVAGHDVVNQLQARPGLDEQRHDSAGKNHDVGKAKHRQHFRQRTCGYSRRAFRFFSRAE